MADETRAANATSPTATAQVAAREVVVSDGAAVGSSTAAGTAAAQVAAMAREQAGRDWAAVGRAVTRGAQTAVRRGGWFVCGRVHMCCGRRVRWQGHLGVALLGRGRGRWRQRLRRLRLRRLLAWVARRVGRCAVAARALARRVELAALLPLDLVPARALVPVLPLVGKGRTPHVEACPLTLLCRQDHCRRLWQHTRRVIVTRALHALLVHVPRAAVHPCGLRPAVNPTAALAHCRTADAGQHGARGRIVSKVHVADRPARAELGRGCLGGYHQEHRRGRRCVGQGGHLDLALTRW